MSPQANEPHDTAEAQRVPYRGRARRAAYTSRMF